MVHRGHIESIGGKKRKRIEGEVAEPAEGERPERWGPLRLMRVKERTQCDYTRVRRNFGKWLKERREEPANQEAFDRAGERYITWVYDTRKPAYWACNLVAAMELYYPLTQGMWILTGAAAAGFRTVKPVHS